jgi:hypothetical protein
MNSPEIVNIVTFAVGFGLLFNSYSLLVQGREDIALVMLSFVAGLGLVVVSVFPGGFGIIAPLIGLEIRTRAMLVISNLTLFVVVVYLLNRTGGLQNKVSKLNEELSLLKHDVDEHDE